VKIQEAKNEDSRGLGKLKNKSNYVPKSLGKLFEDVDLKRHKIGEFGPKKEVPYA